MFGSKARQQLEEQVRELREQLTAEKKAKSDVEAQLKSAQDSIYSLRQELANTDVNQLKKKSQETIAEYEGLKELYTRKTQEFEASREEKEQQFAREEAIQRFNLENDIKENRRENEEYVASTVKTFGETYNYYLNQIKVLMDALSDVAMKTGSVLFTQKNLDLKANFGQMLVDELKAGTDVLRSDNGDLIVIGAEEADKPVESMEETVEEAVDELLEEDALEKEIEEIVAEEVAEAKEEVEELVQEEVDDALEEASEELDEIAAEDAAEIAEEAEEAAEAIAEEAAEITDEAEAIADEAAEITDEAAAITGEAAEIAAEAEKSMDEIAEEVKKASDELA